VSGHDEASPALVRLARLATPVVARAGDDPRATLHSPRLLRDRTRSVVARFAVSGAPVSSVIVKAAAADDAHFFTEWASLDLLTRLPTATGVAPRFLGGDQHARLFAIEDLGGSRSLDDVLREPSRQEALAALAALGRATARLHGATLGPGAPAHERAFDAVRAALPGGHPIGTRAEVAARWESDAPATLAAWRDALGVDAPPRNLDDALRVVASAYRDPGAWLAFTHGDPAPSNNHVGLDGVVRLLDFEYGGFRHALYDVSAWQVLCPLPADALAALRDAYRGTLAAHAPALAHGAAFDAEWAAMVCWRAVAMLGWLGAAATARANAPWVDDWTRREAAIAACERMAAAVDAGGDPRLAPLGAAGAALARAMRARWPEYAEKSVLPRWTALNGES